MRAGHYSNRKIVSLSRLALPLPELPVLPEGCPGCPGAWLRLKATDLIISPSDAGVAKLVYAPDSKSGEVKLMSVRVRPPAPNSFDFLRRSAHSDQPSPNRVQ